MARRPSVPARLRSAHPRAADGRFISKASANRVIGRISAAREREHARARELEARRHGQRARERTEARRTPVQKAAATRAARELEANIKHARRSQAAKRGWETRRAQFNLTREREHARGRPAGGARGAGGATIDSLDDLDDYGAYDEYDDYDVETSPDYEEAAGGH